MAESPNKEETEKLEQFEKVVKALTRKVLSLENKITEMQNKKQPSGKIVDQSLSGSEEEKEIETEKVLSENCLNENISFNTSDIKDNTSTPKVNKVRVKKNKIQDELLSCEICNYKCKKEKSIENHMLTKHTSHECKECKQKLPSVTKLLKHVADNHYEVQGNVQNRTSKDDTTENIEANSINKEGDCGMKDKEKSFVFSESRFFDKFL